MQLSMRSNVTTMMACVLDDLFRFRVFGVSGDCVLYLDEVRLSGLSSRAG